MASVEEVKRPLFLGLTRPPMVAGVTFNFFVFNALFGIVCFLGSGKLPWILVALPTHFIGYLVCLKDANTFEVWGVKMLKSMQCLNRNFWGQLNSYSPW
ncbi:MAG TPA: VirB3 family type IV secretion system protein [Pseudomonadales bacterium]|nr:VirB3 family type IV secretion system protein [Pseudomonadales bacterium]